MQKVQHGSHWDLAALAGAIEESRDAILVGDADARVVLANQVALKVLGRIGQDVAGLPIGEFAAPDTRERQLALYELVLSSGKELTIRGTSATLPAGVPVDSVFGTISTEQGTLVLCTFREADEESEQSRLFRDLLETAPDGMVVLDDLGQIVLVNSRTEALFGYRREELLGAPIQRLVPTALDHIDLADVGHRSDEPWGCTLGAGLDLSAVRADGSCFPVEVTLSRLWTDDGLLVVAAVRDLSERRRVQEASDRAKEEFFATVSHELRTPLTSLIGYGELLADLEEFTAQGRKFLSVMMKGAERELRLVDDLLTLAHAGSRGLGVRPRRLDLIGVVQDAVDAVRLNADDAELELELRTTGDAVPVQGDRDRLGQAIDNVLSNAVKFTPPGGRVGVCVQAAGGRALVEVSDTGPGIDNGERDLVFDRLYRGSQAVSAHTPGAGLGLAIARTIVGAHHGTISVLRSGPAGSIFRIDLPLAQ